MKKILVILTIVILATGCSLNNANESEKKELPFSGFSYYKKENLEYPVQGY